MTTRSMTRDSGSMRKAAWAWKAPEEIQVYMVFSTAWDPSGRLQKFQEDGHGEQEAQPHSHEPMGPHRAFWKAVTQEAVDQKADQGKNRDQPDIIDHGHRLTT